jgi:hypothetical protein
MTIPELNNPVYPPARRESTLAIISLITGILGWTLLPFISSIVAVITGHLAKKEIRESGGTMSGDGMALAGLILGYTMIGLTILALILFFTVIIAIIPGVSNWFSSASALLPFMM